MVRKRKEKDFIVRHKFEFVEVVEKLTTEISEKKKKLPTLFCFVREYKGEERLFLFSVQLCFTLFYFLERVGEM